MKYRPIHRPTVLTHFSENPQSPALVRSSSPEDCVWLPDILPAVSSIRASEMLNAQPGARGVKSLLLQCFSGIPYSGKETGERLVHGALGNVSRGHPDVHSLPVACGVGTQAWSRRI